MTRRDDVADALLAERFASPSLSFGHNDDAADDTDTPRACSMRRRRLLEATRTHDDEDEDERGSV